MDFRSLAQRLGMLGRGVTVHDYPKGGISSHAKRRAPTITPNMRADAQSLEKNPNRLYPNFSGRYSVKPKAI